jgi:hypothetical protein
MTICVEMVLPGILGLWVDEKLGTAAVFTLLGAAAGLTLAIWHLLRMTSSQEKRSDPDPPAREGAEG